MFQKTGKAFKDSDKEGEATFGLSMPENPLNNSYFE